MFPGFTIARTRGPPPVVEKQAGGPCYRVALLTLLTLLTHVDPLKALWPCWRVSLWVGVPRLSRVLAPAKFRGRAGRPLAVSVRGFPDGGGPVNTCCPVAVHRVAVLTAYNTHNAKREAGFNPHLIF